MNTAVIARHLNVVESAITRCEEWAKVLFVVVKGLGARFVSKKIMTEESFYVKESSTGVEYSKDGVVFQSGDYCQVVLSTENIRHAIARFSSAGHSQIALDAGGEVIETSEGWYGGAKKTVKVSLALLEAFCKQFAPAEDDHTGMMQTSTGQWVMADDWDAIEGGM